MATILQKLDPDAAQYLTSAFPSLVRNGTNIPVSALEFTPANDQAAFWKLDVDLYGSGNLTVKVRWYAGTATSGDVDFGAAIAAITPNVDTQDVETDSLATENTVTDSHLGTTAKRIHEAVITVSNLDGLAAGDVAFLRLRCLSSSTIAGVVRVESVEVLYST
jgi:hypothetical protein